MAEPILHGQYYHLYNRGIDGCNVFREEANYSHFLRLYLKHVDPVADTFAYVLMKNHFHLLVRIKDPAETGLSGMDDASDSEGAAVEKPPYRYLADMFNAYSKGFNKRYGRTGSLFQKNIRRKCITSESYLRQVVLYIHNNPVHHGFCSCPEDYAWSSYAIHLSQTGTILKRDAVIEWFGGIENFRYLHNLKRNSPPDLPGL